MGRRQFSILARISAAVVFATAVFQPIASHDLVTPSGPSALRFSPSRLPAVVEAGAVERDILLGQVAAMGSSAAPGGPRRGGKDVRINEPGADETFPHCNVQNEVDIARWRNVLVAGWNDSGACENVNSGIETDVYDSYPSGISSAGYGWSHDGGRTWHDGGFLPPEEGGNVWGDPVLAASNDGIFYYATLVDARNRPGRIGVARSRDRGKTWTAPVVASGRVPGWQDKPWLTVDTTDSSHAGNVYVAWTFGGRGKPIWIARSVDDGKTYEKPVRLTDKPRQEGHGVQLAVGPEGEVYAVWVTFPPPYAPAEDYGLWFTRSLDGGETFARPTKISSLQLIGHPEPRCGGFGASVRSSNAQFQFIQALNGNIHVANWPSLAVDTSRSRNRGRIYVAVPSREQPPDESDVFIQSSGNGGRTWTELEKINDDETENDNFHPQVAVDDRGKVMVSWYDRRLGDEGPLLNYLLDVFAAFSLDGGDTFSRNFRVSDVSFPPSRYGTTGCAMGEYNGLTVGRPGEFLLNWGDNRDLTGGVPDPNVYFDRVRT